MKLSNYTPSPKRLTSEQKQLIESYFTGKIKFTNDKGVILNKSWQIAQLTGLKEGTVNRYVDSLIYEKRKKMNNENN
jgi:hypothetical protein